MEYKEVTMETIFDVLSPMEAATLDSTEIEAICKQQQSLTFDRISKWLLVNSILYTKEGQVQMSKQVKGLSEELKYLSYLAIQ